MIKITEHGERWLWEHAGVRLVECPECGEKRISGMTNSVINYNGLIKENDLTFIGEYECTVCNCVFNVITESGYF